MRAFALGVRFWSGPAPVVGWVTPRGIVKCLDHTFDGNADHALHADSSFREAGDVCETAGCGRHVCAAYLEGNRPTYFAGDGSPRGHWDGLGLVPMTACPVCGKPALPGRGHCSDACFRAGLA